MNKNANRRTDSQLMENSCTIKSNQNVQNVPNLIIYLEACYNVIISNIFQVYSILLATSPDGDHYF